MATKKSAQIMTIAAIEDAKVGDTINVEVSIENTGETDLSGAKLTSDKITWSAGDGYTHDDKTATITKLEKTDAATVKGSYVLVDGDKPSVTLSCTLKHGSFEKACTSEAITVSAQE